MKKKNKKNEIDLKKQEFIIQSFEGEKMKFKVFSDKKEKIKIIEWIIPKINEKNREIISINDNENTIELEFECKLINEINYHILSNEEKLQEKRKRKNLEMKYNLLQETIEKDEIILFEYIFKKEFHSILYNRNKNESILNLWDRCEKRQNLSFLMETEDRIKFGVFISSRIDKRFKYINDENCFIFKINENNQIEMYPIIESNNAIKFDVYECRDVNLIEIGKGDILIKNIEGKFHVDCKQQSFNYFGKINTLTENNKDIPLKHFYIYEMFDFDYLKIQFEYLTQMKYDKLIFDGRIHSWVQDFSVFDTRIFKKKKKCNIIC